MKAKHDYSGNELFPARQTGHKDRTRKHRIKYSIWDGLQWSDSSRKTVSIMVFLQGIFKSF